MLTLNTVAFNNSIFMCVPKSKWTSLSLYTHKHSTLSLPCIELVDHLHWAMTHGFANYVLYSAFSFRHRLATNNWCKNLTCNQYFVMCTSAQLKLRFRTLSHWLTSKRGWRVWLLDAQTSLACKHRLKGQAYCAIDDPPTPSCSARGFLHQLVHLLRCSPGLRERAPLAVRRCPWWWPWFWRWDGLLMNGPTARVRTWLLPHQLVN